MTLHTLYPFWPDTHALWLDTIKTLTEADLDHRSAPRSVTIRRVLLDFVRRERLLVAHLVAGWERETPTPGGTRTGAEMASALSAARETTNLALLPCSAENMRSVRLVPEGVFGNEPAGNVTVAFCIWSLLEEECAARGIVAGKLGELKG